MTKIPKQWYTGWFTEITIDNKTHRTKTWLPHLKSLRQEIFGESKFADYISTFAGIRSLISLQP